MALYLVTFDLHDGGERYEKIEEEISRVTAMFYEKVNHNVFICRYRGLGIHFRNEFDQHLHQGEKLIITKISDITVGRNEQFSRLDSLAISEGITVSQ